MPAKKSFTLTRRLPSGEEKTGAETFPTLRKAAQSAAYVLHYNTRISRREVNQAASRVQDAPLGEWTDAPGGYAFRIDVA